MSKPVRPTIFERRPGAEEIVSMPEPFPVDGPADGRAAESPASAVEPASRAIQAFISRPEFSVRRSAVRQCRFEPHSHASYSVTAVLAGSMRVHLGGGEALLMPGMVAFTGIGESHSAEADDVDFVSIRISPALVNMLAAEIELIRAAAEIVFRSAYTTDDGLLATVRQIASELLDAKPGYETMIEALVRQMSVQLLRTHLTVRKSAQIELSRAGPVDRRLRRAIEFMHDNYGRELALEEIAAAAYVSEYHFARLFKQITGTTPHVYLANIRIEKARRMLVETALPIIEVAAMVGYQSQSHFTKIFKSVTGLTPRAYRESSQR